MNYDDARNLHHDGGECQGRASLPQKLRIDGIFLRLGNSKFRTRGISSLGFDESRIDHHPVGWLTDDNSTDCQFQDLDHHDSVPRLY
mmetsp:Transcript_24856/g.58354  ORF Transcript_24856/g.58354 Transcript_24856/m.58354 type:complete len:87 (+) Transcript_24856:1248-1508(+)